MCHVRVRGSLARMSQTGDEPAGAFEEGAGVLLVDGQGRILLQQRDDDVPPAGHGRWAIPGGHVEPGESPRAAALREMAEETGLRLTQIRHYGTFDREREASGRVQRLHLFFSGEAVDENAIEVNEGLDFGFWAAEAIASLPMNPWPRGVLEGFIASDLYRGELEANAAYAEGVAVLALDRWGRVLLQLRDDDLPPARYPGVWSLAGGYLQDGEAPDAAALREFEEETGHLLQELELFRVYRRGEIPGLLVDVQHVYYCDPDIPEELISVNEGQAFRYFGPAEIDGLKMPEHAGLILREFFASGAYKALFH